MDRNYQPTTAVQSAFILVLVCASIAALNLPVRSVNGQQSSDQTYLGRLDETVASGVTRVGFPWTFHTSNVSSGVSVSEHSIISGLADAAVAVFVVAIVIGWLYCRFGRATHPICHWIGHRISGVSLTAAGLFAVMTLTTTSIALRYSNEQQAIASLGSNVRAVQGVSMPENLSQRLPKQLQRPWQHAENVVLNTFDDASISTLSKLSGVGVLHLSHGQIDDEAADKIAKMSMLRMLDLRDIDFSGLRPEGIAKWSSLTSLRVSSSQLSDSLASALVTLPNLRELHVTDVPHVIETIGQQVTGSAIQELKLVAITSLADPIIHSDSATSNDFDVRVRLGSALQLRKLSLIASRGARVELSMSDLPQLATLGLSVLNVVSLEAKNLPRWNDIDSIGGAIAQYTEDEETFASPLLERVQLTDCHSLAGLRFHSRYVDSVEIHGVSNINRIIFDQWDTRFLVREHSHSEREATSARFGQLIRQLSSVETLRELELLNLKLSGVDMTPLSKLRRLTTLDLAGCEIDSEQVLELLGIEKLNSLNLVGTGTRQQVIDALLCGSDRWKRLLINASTFDKLDLVNQFEMTEFFSQNYFQARQVSLLNVPRIQGELRLTRDLDLLRIENAPSLRGVIVAGDIPAGTRISGVAELKVFEAGGPGVTDELLRSVSQCIDLRKLVLRSGNITRQSLPLITGLSRLDTLHLPGMPVDDELISHWKSLKFLRDVVLDRTNIGPKSIEQLAHLENLQRLSISHTKLTPEDLRALGNASAIIRLDVAGVGILPETLAEIARAGLLYQLDISNVKVSEELLQVLASKELHTLSVLKLSGSGLTDAQIQRLASANPSLVFDVPRNEFGKRVYDSLTREERVLLGSTFTGRYVRSGAAAEVLLESPYSGSSSLDQARIIRFQELRGGRSRQLIP